MFKVIRTVIKPNSQILGFNDQNVTNLYAQLVSLLTALPHDKFLGIEYNTNNELTFTITFNWASESDRNTFNLENQELVNQLTTAINNAAAVNGITTFITTETV